MEAGEKKNEREKKIYTLEAKPLHVSTAGKAFLNYRMYGSESRTSASVDEKGRMGVEIIRLCLRNEIRVKVRHSVPRRNRLIYTRNN